MSKPHETRPIKVWVDADLGVADMVEYLNTIPGVRTTASCQGTIGECGACPYRAHVMCHWTPEALQRLRTEFDVVPDGNGSWGLVHPRSAETHAQRAATPDPPIDPTSPGAFPAG